MARTATEARPVVIHLTGGFRVERDGSPLEPAEIGSHKARQLLALLAARRTGDVAAIEIVHALWTTHPPADPQAVVASLVSRLRRILGGNVIVGGRRGYRLGGPPDVIVDVDQAWTLIEQAQRCVASGTPALAVTAARAALRQLREGTGTDAALDAEAAGLRRRARHALATAALQTGDAAVARDTAAAAISADPLDEAATRLLMSAYVALAEPAGALLAYDELRRNLADQLGADPAAVTYELYLAALHGEPHVPETSNRPSEQLGLVGRDAEFAALREAWSDAVGGHGGRVLVTGEAGIGKTRLAYELAALATRTGGLVASGRCFEAERSLFAQAVVDALAELLVRLPVHQVRTVAAGHLSTLARLLPELHDVLGGAEPTDEAQPGEQERRYAAIAGLLRALSGTTPVLLLIDDLQHAASSTLELLHNLRRKLSRCPVLVVATLRDDEGHEALTTLADDSTTIALGPLSDNAVGELAARAGQSSRGAEIARRTGGHPLFLVETLRALAAGQVGLPATLQAAVLERVEKTGPSTDRLLRAGAVLGAAFDPAVAAVLVGMPEHVALPGLERGLAARLLVASGREYEFVHDVVRDVLLETTPSPTRLAYHRRAADVLAATPEAVAVHAEAIGDRARAGRAWLLAADQAMARFAAADAAILATRAIAAANETDDAELRGRALVTRGRSRDATAEYPPALADFESARAAARQAGDRRLEMIVLRELAGDVPVALGRAPATCESPLLDCLALAEGLGDRSIEADVLDRLAVLACSHLDFTSARGLALRSAAAGRSSGDERALACGLDALKTSVAYLGDIPALLPVLDELEPLLRRRGDLWMLQWTLFERAVVPLAAEDYDAAIALMNSASEVCRRSGYTAHDAFFRAHVGWAHRLAGRLDLALEEGRRAVEHSRQFRHTWWSTTASSLLAGTLLAAGRASDAARLASEVRVAASAPGAESYLLRCLGVLAEASGSLEVLEAADALVHTIKVPRERAWLLGADAYLGVARAWTVAGRPDRAIEVLAPFRAAAAAGDWPALVRLADEISPP